MRKEVHFIQLALECKGKCLVCILLNFDDNFGSVSVIFSL